MKNLLNKIKSLFKRVKTEELKSSYSGKVVKIGKSKISGKYIQILDDKGFKHFYGQLHKTKVKLGDVIQDGDVIALIEAGSYKNKFQTNKKLSGWNITIIKGED